MDHPRSISQSDRRLLLRLSRAGELPGRRIEPDLVDLSVYDLDDVDLTAVAGIMFSVDCDQAHLERRRGVLDAFVSAGGRVVVHGRITRPFLTGLPLWRRSGSRKPEELTIHRVSEHPVWAGVDPEDLLSRAAASGGSRPDAVTLAALPRRGYSRPLPEGSIVVNGLGPRRAPIDFEYRIGRGTVLVHNGHDLDAFGPLCIAPALRSWLRAEPGFEPISATPWTERTMAVA